MTELNGLVFTEAQQATPEQGQITVSSILATREKTHGDFAVAAKISQNLKLIMWDTEGWHRLTPVQREALEMAQLKIARILSGDPNCAEHWTDAQGYLALPAASK